MDVQVEEPEEGEGDEHSSLGIALEAFHVTLRSNESVVHVLTARSHGPPPLGSARARFVRLLRARPAALGGQTFPEGRGRATGRPPTASARARRLPSQRLHRPVAPQVSNATIVEWQQKYDSTMRALSDDEEEADMERLDAQIQALLTKAGIPAYNATQARTRTACASRLHRVCIARASSPRAVRCISPWRSTS